MATFRALAAVMTCGQVQAKPNIDGAWKLSKPQTLLTPANGEPIPFTAEGKKIYGQNKALAQQGKFGFDEIMDRCASPGQVLQAYRVGLFRGAEPQWEPRMTPPALKEFNVGVERRPK
jgi:hypothetical protein